MALELEETLSMSEADSVSQVAMRALSRRLRDYAAEMQDEPVRQISTGGETKRHFVLRWLREKELEREARAHQSNRYLRLTFWVAVATLVAAIVGVMATVLHP
jgi:hypothetical protein